MVLAATIICGATAFTSCTNDDNPATPDLGVKEKIMGKWIEVEIDGQHALTSDKSVVTFVSSTKAIYSTSKTDFTESQPKWAAHREYDANISGNKVILTGHPEGNAKITLFT